VSKDLEFTGERFVPGTHGEIWVEHWHRYHFAARWVRGKRVLDVACGEGYGSAVLAREAASVTGVDISPEAIAHAQSEYASMRKLHFVEGSCTRLPLADASIDVAVSFETVEHIAEQDQFLDELARVLTADGVLILSSPNKLEYSDKRDFRNEFHVKELYRDDLARLVDARFPASAWYGQRPSFFSVIAPETAVAAGQLLEVSESEPESVSARLESPLYFILVASRNRAGIDAAPPVVSVLADRDDWIHRDYEKVMADQVKAVARIAFVEGLVDERDHLVAGLQKDIEAWEGRLREEQQAHAAEVERRQADIAELKAVIADLRATLAARDATIDQKQGEIDRRGGLRWWLKLPLHRFGILKR
jgi:SAM-dependent methyltransferase